jgi:hypothetical protein
MLSRGQDFVTQVEGLMEKTIGRLVGQSILKNQLKKLNKERDALSADDCNTLVQHIVGALSVFVTKQEVETASYQLERLYKAHFA